MTKYYSYHPTEFHFTGFFDAEEQPENSTTVAVPMCDGERYAKWEEDKWVVKHLVNGVWVNCTDTLGLNGYVRPLPEETSIIEGDTNETI